MKIVSKDPRKLSRPRGWLPVKRHRGEPGHTGHTGHADAQTQYLGRLQTRIYKLASDLKRSLRRANEQRDAGVNQPTRTVWIAADFSLPLLRYAEVQGHPLRDGLRLEALGTLGRQHVGLEGLERGEA